MSDNIVEVLFEVVKTQNGPGLQGNHSHVFDEYWVGATMYLVLERYTSSLSDEKQLEFQNKVMGVLDNLIEIGPKYLSKLNPVTMEEMD